jgi:hypothetical protein
MRTDKTSERASDAIKRGDLDVLAGFLDSAPELVRAMAPFDPRLHVESRRHREQLFFALPVAS